MEEVLSMHAVEEMQSRLRDRLHPQNWTVENRDTELDAIRDTALEIVEESTPLTLALLNKAVDGKPFLYWNLQTQVLGQLIEYLEQARRDLDWLTDEERSETSVDTEWLTQQIRKTLELYQVAQANVDQMIAELKSSSLVETEEV